MGLSSRVGDAYAYAFLKVIYKDLTFSTFTHLVSDMLDFSTLFNAYPSIEKFLANPTYDAKKKKQFLNEFFGNSLNPLIMNFLNLLCDTKRIGWAVKTINAPVIETGVNKAFGLKSAVLLNMLSCVKNYTSIESFDLSLNRDNEDVLSSLLNTNKYPSKFQLWKTPSLIMRLFFLTSIKEAVKTSKLLDQFSGNFMNVTIQEAAKVDETTKKIQSALETLNSTFAASIFSELYNDFGGGGTLDVTIESDIKRLKQIAEAT